MSIKNIVLSSLDVEDNSITKIGKNIKCTIQKVENIYKKRYARWSGALLLFGTALLLSVGCNETPGNQSDTTAPEPITVNEASISATPSSITFGWTPSVSNDVAGIRITWTPEDGEEQPKIIGNEIRETTITDLEANTEYAFSIVTIDRSANESAAVAFSVTTPSFAVSFAAESYSFTDIQSTPGSVVGTVSATVVEDPSAGITYAIVPNDISTLFAIDADTGEITVGGSGINAETQYDLTVQATSSQNATATAGVVIIPFDNIAPAPITSPGAVVDSGTAVTLNWKNSISNDVAEVRITWEPEESNGATGITISDGADTTPITGLTSETPYTFIFVVVDNNGNVSASEDVMATTADITGPLPVTIPTVTADSGTAITLGWTDSASPDAADVRIVWAVAGTDIGNTEVRHGVGMADITRLTSETEYDFRLTVVDADGNPSSGNTNITHTTADITGPEPVTALSASADSGTEVTLTWTGSTSADVDEVRITWTNAGATGVTGVPAPAGMGMQTHTITGLTSETPYTFTLTVFDDAVDIAGNPNPNESTLESYTVTTLDVTDPAPVTMLNAVPDANGSVVSLTWKDSISADADEVHITWTPAGITGTAETRVMRGTQAATITELDDGTDYTFRAVAEDAANNVSLPDTVTVRTIDVTNPAPLTNVQATTMAGTTDVTLSWDSSISPDATTIGIVWGITGLPTSGTRDIPHGTTTTGSTTILGLISEEHYTFTLVVFDNAVDVAGDSAPNASSLEDVSIRTPDTNSPDPVSNFTATPLAIGTEVELRWTNSVSADAYMLNIAWSSATPGITPGDVSIRSGMGDSTHTIAGLNFVTPYTFTITVVDTVGNTSNIETANPDPVTTLANPIDVNGNGFVDINSLDQLNNIRHNLAGTSYKTSSGDGGVLCGVDATTVCTGYELTQSLNFANGSSYDSGTINAAWRPNNGNPNNATNAGWEPIGNCGNNGTCDDGDDAPFATAFEGNGYTIRNLYTRNEGVVGLFGNTNNNATIRSLGLVGNSNYGTSRNRDFVGGLAGWNGGTITASYATGTARATRGSVNRVGGLAGHNAGIIIASYATGNVDTQGIGVDDRVGGLVGRNGDTIIASYATGNANGGGGNFDYVGGLVGQNDSNSTIIIASYATGTANGGSGNTDAAGGLVGWNRGGTITASYATGNANGGGGTSDPVGALVGFTSNGGTVTASYGFGSSLNGESAGTDDSGDRPSGVSGAGSGIAGARQLTAPGTDVTTAVPAVWNQARSDSMNAWHFGTTMQAPALNYADYDGTDTTYGCGNASVADIVIPTTVPNGSGGTTTVTCGSTLLAAQQPR